MTLAGRHTVGRREVSRRLPLSRILHPDRAATSPRSNHGVPSVLPQQQSSRKDPDSDREVFRSAGSIVLSWAWLIVAVITLIDLAVQGRDHAALVTAVLIVAITAVVYGCAWRPRIIADSTGITVANPLRDHRVPWSAVSNVDVVNAVRVHCTPAPGSASGRILYSWAVQASPSSARRAARRAGLSGQRPRLTRPRYSRANPPPGATPGYGQIPEPRETRWTGPRRSSPRDAWPNGRSTPGRPAPSAPGRRRSSRPRPSRPQPNWPNSRRRTGPGGRSPSCSCR